jgi:hypothetical protein
LIEAAGAIVAGRAPHSWRRVLVSVALGLIALAVVGMHQLSLGHLFVATADYPAMATRTAPARTRRWPHMLALT